MSSAKYLILLYAVKQIILYMSTLHYSTHHFIGTFNLVQFEYLGTSNLNNYYILLVLIHFWTIYAFVMTLYLYFMILQLFFKKNDSKLGMKPYTNCQSYWIKGYNPMFSRMIHFDFLNMKILYNFNATNLNSFFLLIKKFERLLLMLFIIACAILSLKVKR